MAVLRSEQDYYDLAMAYFGKASSHDVVYAEVFFDPQAHTSRGVPFQTVIGGLDRARNDAADRLGLQAKLIMCFLRDLPADDAMRTLEQAAPFRDKIIGVGLDSDEKDNPPVKFAEVFREARAEGYHITMHCDPDDKDSVTHIWQCIDDIGVERIDHGTNCVEDPRLLRRLGDARMGLTVCPISNRWLTDGLKTAAVKTTMDHGLRPTINSDDPAYFSGYIGDNFAAISRDGMTPAEIEALTRNAFEIAWLTDEERARYVTQNSLPSGSSITTVSEGSRWRPATDAPASTSLLACASIFCSASGSSGPAEQRMSRCTRFLAVLPSGTFWRKIRGPSPSGSTIAHWSPNFSSGMPYDRNRSSRVSNPGGSGWVMYPSASDQNSPSSRGCAASYVT
jgi:adenosine deaminase